MIHLSPRIRLYAAEVAMRHSCGMGDNVNVSATGGTSTATATGGTTTINVGEGAGAGAAPPQMKPTTIALAGVVLFGVLGGLILWGSSSPRKDNPHRARRSAA